MKKLILSLLISISAIIANAQCGTEYRFRNPTLTSGVYKFTNVKSGVDVFITPISSNNATLTTIDDSTNYAYGWNPIIQFTSSTTSSTDSSWVEFLVEFKSGSALDTQACITMTAVDLDGASTYKEYVQSSRPVNVTGYLMTPITWSANSIWHTAYSGTSQITGPDTLAFDGMAAFGYSNVQQYKIRIGVLGQVLANQTNDYYFYGKYFDSLPIPLPVKWIDIRGSVVDEDYQLTWLVDEISVKSYSVERLVNNTEWTSIAKIQSRAYGLNTYSTTVNLIDAGSKYFRIKQIDYNGNFSYSQVLVASSTPSESEVIEFFDVFGTKIYEGTYLDFLAIANYGELYITSTGKKFIKL